MNNKTCGECKYFFLHSEGHCKSNDGLENAHNDACTFFEPKVITNGDKIRQMSNEELASIISTSCDKCGYRPNQCISDDEKTCYKGHLAWLNASAESEGKDEK